MTKTFNPFKIIGSWLGLAVGYLLFLKGIDAFAFIFEYTSIPISNLLARNMTAGFMLGFTAHIFLRAFFNMGILKAKKIREMKEYKEG